MSELSELLEKTKAAGNRQCEETLHLIAEKYTSRVNLNRRGPIKEAIMETKTQNGNEKIANLTQHRATEEQVADGVVDLSEEKREELKWLLTFSELPSQALLERRACEVVRLILGKFDKAMIGGAPYFMRPLEEKLEKMGIQVLYSFSKRESEEIPQEDGSVKKIMVFRHVGFVKK